MTHSKCRMVPSWRSVSSPSSPPSSSSSTSSSWPGVILQACGHLESSIFLFPDQWGTDAGKHQVLCRYFNVKCFRRPFRNPPHCYNTWSQPNIIFVQIDHDMLLRSNRVLSVFCDCISLCKKTDIFWYCRWKTKQFAINTLSSLQADFPVKAR